MFAFNHKDEKWWYLILTLLTFFSFYFALGSYPLLDNNEGLYATIAKQMVTFKNFIIPHLNCVPYIEKPPFLYWLLSLSFYFFGFTATAARLVTTTGAALICIMLVYVGQKLKLTKVGLIGAIIFASSIGVSLIARMVYTDMLFTFLVSGSLLGLFYWYETQKKSALRLSYLFFGLAFLTKGLAAGVLIWGSFILFLAWEGKIYRLRKVLDPMGIAIGLGIILPWHIAAAINHPGFIRKYLFEEHFLRFLNQRVPYDYYHGPFYYYLPRMMIYIFPWSVFTPLLFWRNQKISILEQTLMRFSWSWVLVPLLFFSLSGAKANYYMIVSVPALALLLGVKLKYLLKQNRSKVINIWAGTTLLITALTLSITYWLIKSKLVFSVVTIRLFFITISYLLLASMAVFFGGKRKNIILVIFAGVIIPSIVTGITWIKSLKQDSPFTAVATGIYLSEIALDKPLFLYQDFENISGLFFYAPGCFKIIDSQSNDLYYAKQLPNFKTWFIDMADFLQVAKTQPLLVIVPIKKLLYFLQNTDPINFYWLKKFNQVVIVSNYIET